MKSFPRHRLAQTCGFHHLELLGALASKLCLSLGRGGAITLASKLRSSLCRRGARRLTPPSVLSLGAERLLRYSSRSTTKTVGKHQRLEPFRAVLGRVFHVIGSSWKPRREKLSTPPTRLNLWLPSPGAPGNLGVETVSVTGPWWGRNLGVEATSVTVPLWGPRADATVHAEPWCLVVVTVHK